MKLQNKILKYIVLLLLPTLIINVFLQKFNSAILYFTITFSFICIVVFFYLQHKKYKNQSSYIYNIHIDCLPILLKFLKIKNINTQKIKEQYFNNYCEKEDIFCKKNIWGVNHITHIEISICPIRFYQNILLTVKTRNEDFIQKINQLHLEPTPLWLFYNQNTKQKYTDVQEFIQFPPARFNNWYQHNFKLFWVSLNQKEKEKYCIKYNATKEWEELMYNIQHLMKY